MEKSQDEEKIRENVAKLEKFLEENNLGLSISPLNIQTLDNGSIVISRSVASVVEKESEIIKP